MLIASYAVYKDTSFPAFTGRFAFPYPPHLVIPSQPLFPVLLSSTSKGPTWIRSNPVSDQVKDAFRNINDEMCVLHNDVHIGNIILRTTDRTPVIMDFGYAMIREPNMSDAKWTEIARQCSDISAMRSNPANGKWRRKQTPKPMSNYTGKYKTPFHFNKYVQRMPEDYRRATFERIPNTDGSGTREKGFQWRIRPGVRCRE